MKLTTATVCAHAYNGDTAPPNPLPHSSQPGVSYPSDLRCLLQRATIMLMYQRRAPPPAWSAIAAAAAHVCTMRRQQRHLPRRCEGCCVVAREPGVVGCARFVKSWGACSTAPWLRCCSPLPLCTRLWCQFALHWGVPGEEYPRRHARLTSLQTTGSYSLLASHGGDGLRSSLTK